MNKTPKTTLKYKGIEYPFYKTNRGNWDWENAGFSMEGLLKGKDSDQLALVYFTVRDCAKRAAMIFEDSLDDFIDNSEPDVINVFQRLSEEKTKIEEEAKAKKAREPRPAPEQEPAPGKP